MARGVRRVAACVGGVGVEKRVVWAAALDPDSFDFRRSEWGFRPTPKAHTAKHGPSAGRSPVAPERAPLVGKAAGGPLSAQGLRAPIGASPADP